MLEISANFEEHYVCVVNTVTSEKRYLHNYQKISLQDVLRWRWKDGSVNLKIDDLWKQINGSYDSSEIQKMNDLLLTVDFEVLFNRQLPANQEKFEKEYKKEVVGKFAKEKNKLIFEYIGCSQKQFLKHLNSLMYKVFVVPLDDRIKKICYRHKGFVPSRINNYWDIKGEVDQALEDNQLNIAILCMGFQDSRANLRERFGKGLWKKLMKVPYTKLIKMCDFGNGQHNQKTKDEMKVYLNNLLESSYTLLTSGIQRVDVDGEAIWFLTKNFKGSYKKNFTNATHGSNLF